MTKPALASAPVDLNALIQAATNSGPLWGHASDDLNITILHWQEGEGVAAHVNAELDVVMMVVGGAGVATIDGVDHAVTAGHMLVIPKGTERAMRATAETFSYVNVHRRRRGIWPSMPDMTSGSR